MNKAIIRPRYTSILFAIAFFLLSIPASQAQVSKVELYPFMLVNESGDGDASLLIDEQDLSGDPLNGSSSVPVNSWSTSYSADYPMGAYIDLGQKLNLVHVFIFDFNGIGDLIVEYGEPGDWKYLFTEPLNKYKKWKQHDISVSSRYLRFVKTGAGPKFSEIVIYADNPVLVAPAITDLLASNPGNNSVDLSWTDVEGNSATGSFSEYDLRFSTDSINEDNFYTCNAFQISNQPQTGIFQSTTVSGLLNNTPYYFAIKEVGEFANSTISNIATQSTLVFANEIEEKLFLEPGMLANPSGYGEAWKLVDEQELAGDPANSPGGNPINYWQTGYQSSIPYPLYAILDLGREVEVTKVFMRDSYNVGDFTIWTGYDQNWELKATDNLSGYLSWNQHEINTETRFLRFGKSSAKANVAEVVVYGIDRTGGLIDDALPGTILDLEAFAGLDSVSSVNLSWTAPGDDQMQGTCVAYDLRFNTVEITPENFNESTQWPVMPDPAEAGIGQEVEITGLNPATTYYFALVAMDDNFNVSEISNIASFTTGFELGGAPFKITLTPEMILNENVQGDASLLVDEQSEAGDPKLNGGGTPATVYNPGSESWKYPCYVLIDLGGNCLVSDVYLHDVNNSDTLSVFVGEPFDWNLAFMDELENEDQWNRHTLNQESRFLRLKIHSAQTRISEIVVYASRLEEVEAIPEPTLHQYPTMDQLIGINAFIDDPLGRMAVAGFVREYHSWMWCEGNQSPDYPGYPANENKFNVMGWNFDSYYRNFHQAGITACPAIQKNVLWLTDFEYSKLNDKPVSPGENPEDPFAYAEHADHLYQYAARYGAKNVNDNLLKLAEGQERISGKGWLNYYENWNEQDKWWLGRDAFFTPYEYAAMTSADKDGHMGQMGNTLGVVNADPQAKLVMSGLAKPDLDYVKALKLWSDYHRNGDFPLDVINVHHYCNDGSTQSSGNVGVSPEADNFKELMQAFVAYRNRYLPGKEVWITEFGYDTHPSSVQRAPEVGSYSQEEVQAQWLVRSYFALAAAGVDKAAMYMLRDVDPNSTTKFNTSGLCASKSNGWEPKPAWYYVYTLKNRLQGMRFDSEIESGNQHVMIYKFVHAESSNVSYALWCPSSNETYVDDFEFAVEPGIQNVSLVQLVDGSIYGEESQLSIIDAKVKINVSERPVFVEFKHDSTPLYQGIVSKFNLDASMIVNESGQGDATLMVDEQSLAGDPYMGIGGEPISMWSPGFSADYPVHAYIDLGSEQNIEVIYLRDLNGTGDMSISVGSPGNWTEVSSDDCMRYKIWSNHVIKQNSRYVRLTKYAPAANFSEIVLYVKN